MHSFASEQVMASPKVVGDLTVQQCCPQGDGAAAVIVASEAAIRRLGLDKRRAVRVLASVANSEELEHGESSAVVDMVRKSTAMAYEQAGIGPHDLNLVELHEAFSIEELVYTEAMDLCAPGEGAAWLERGASAIGGQCAVNASGGLLGMGHPVGPIGIGQIAEITRPATARRAPGAGSHDRARLGGLCTRPGGGALTPWARQPRVRPATPRADIGANIIPSKETSM